MILKQKKMKPKKIKKKQRLFWNEGVVETKIVMTQQSSRGTFSFHTSFTYSISIDVITPHLSRNVLKYHNYQRHCQTPPHPGNVPKYHWHFGTQPHLCNVHLNIIDGMPSHSIPVSWPSAIDVMNSHPSLERVQVSFTKSHPTPSFTYASIIDVVTPHPILQVFN